MKYEIVVIPVEPNQFILSADFQNGYIHYLGKFQTQSDAETAKQAIEELKGAVEAAREFGHG